MSNFTKKLDYAWFIATGLIMLLWWPVLALLAIIALVSIAFSMAGCTPPEKKMTSDECVKICKEGFKELTESNLKDCNAAIDKVRASCVSRKTPSMNAPVRILAYKVKVPVCACAYPTDRAYKDPKCKQPYCEGGVGITMKVKNGKVDAAGYMRVECFVYNMKYPDSYIRRMQEHFKPNKNGTHATVKFFVDFDHSVMRNSNVKKGTPIGTACFVVTPDPPTVQMVAKMPARTQSMGEPPPYRR